MSKTVAKIYAVLVAGLALAGLFTNGHLFNLMNVDIALDLLRVVLAGGLIYAAFVAKDSHLANTMLLTVGVLYVGMGLLGLVSPTLGGLLPSGLTGFDIAFHLVTGVAAAGVALMERQGKLTAIKG
jgi:hypothetical protein